MTHRYYYEWKGDSIINLVIDTYQRFLREKRESEFAVVKRTEIFEIINKNGNRIPCKRFSAAVGYFAVNITPYYIIISSLLTNFKTTLSLP